MLSMVSMAGLHGRSYCFPKQTLPRPKVCQRANLTLNSTTRVFCELMKQSSSCLRGTQSTVCEVKRSQQHGGVSIVIWSCFHHWGWNEFLHSPRYNNKVAVHQLNVSSCWVTQQDNDNNKICLLEFLLSECKSLTSRDAVEWPPEKLPYETSYKHGGVSHWQN